MRGSYPQHSYAGGPGFNPGLTSTLCLSPSLAGKNPSGYCQEMETPMVQACRAQQPLHTHPSGHLGGWAMQWSAEKMLDDNVKEWTSLPMPDLLKRPLQKDWKGDDSAEHS